MDRFVLSQKSCKRCKDVPICNLIQCFSPAQILMLGFAGLIIAGTILLTLPAATHNGTSTPFLTALFTATSAVCVTGLTVVDTATHYSLFGQIVILFLIQAGGLGIMTMTTFFAFILGKRINLRERLIIQEATNALNLQGVVLLTKGILVFTFLFEGIGAVIMAFLLHDELGWGQGFYFGIFHSIAAFCNAGFDLFGTIHGPFSSLMAYQDKPGIFLVAAALFIFGGLGFMVISDVLKKKKFSKLTVHSKMVLTITGLLIIIGTASIWLLEQHNTLSGLSPLTAFLSSFFQAVTPRTAGFSTLDIGSLRIATQFLIIILMFIGASPGSTGGGIKTTTFGTIILSAWSVITGKLDVEVGNRHLPNMTIIKAQTIALLAALLILAVTLTLTITEQTNFLTALFETVSAFSTVGLTMGLTPHLSSIGQILIILTMYIGRLGPLTVAYGIWRRQKPRKFRYPEEKIIVG